jgi:hypothetical protein
MILSDLIQSHLPLLQREAESLMLDYGKALQVTGPKAYDSAAQAEVEPTADLFESPYKIQTRNLVARESEVAGRTATTIRVELHLPASTEPLATGDLWECVTPSADSFETAGDRWRVTGIAAGSLKTARRYEVERVLS